MIILVCSLDSFTRALVHKICFNLSQQIKNAKATRPTANMINLNHEEKIITRVLSSVNKC